MLFLLVVLVNLGLLMWYLQHDGGSRGRTTAGPAGPALVRVQERPMVEPLGPEPEQPEGEGSPEPLDCIAVGPFQTRRAMTPYEDAWRTRGFAMGVRMREIKEPVGLWVYLPPTPSREAAAAAVRALEARGLSDFYIVSEPGRENAVSLGLYKNQALAEERWVAVKRAGFEPRLEPGYRRRAEYWFDLLVPPVEVASVATVLREDPEPGVELHRRDCAQPYGLEE